ncbi:protein kinase domain-containing protein [Propionicimonas sp.]|uniref:protein kinase domain-containing protein n=1 Tax=Propionicimonas sp. TaxID=1955623 RepID=UPI0039E391DA
MEIGGFTLGQQLPGGRFGARWRARTGEGDEVVLKELPRPSGGPRPEGPDFGRVHDLAGENVARLDEPVRDAEGRSWLVEEWVDGVSLGALTQEHTLSTAQALGVARGVLTGLASLHAAGVAHGLVSPATVMLTLAGTPKLVDTATWPADPEVATTDEYAAPEVAAGAAPDPRADVFSAAKVFSELLDGSVAGAVGAVLAKASDADASARHEDAGGLLAELAHAAERAYGPLWWTLEGIGAAVASAVGVGAATASATVAVEAGAGAVPGSLAGSAAFLAGGDAGSSGAGVLGNAVRTGTRLRRLIPIVVGGIVVGGIGIALANPVRPQGTEPETFTAPVLTASPSATAGQTPTPTPTTPLELGFNGDYEYVTVLTRSNVPRVKVGTRSREFRTVTTTCDQDGCSTVMQIADRSVPTIRTADGWTQDDRFDEECVNTETNEVVSTDNPSRSIRTLRIDKVVDGRIVRLVGTSRFFQLKKCADQTEKLLTLTYKVTMTLKE